MNIYPVHNNNLCAKTTNFKANFIQNKISEELIKISSADDIADFRATCEALKTAKKDQYSYFLSGVTSNYGFCCEEEVADKFISLNYKTSSVSTSGCLRNWILRTENIVSGGCEKKNILKEITKYLKEIIAKDSFNPAYTPSRTILKKATFVSKVI